MSIDIANETDYGTEQGVDAEELVGVARYVLGEMGIHPMAELSILLVDTAAMEQLHIQWMDEPGPTDVLSFPMDELRPARAEDDNEPVPGLLGDVVLCPEVAERAGQGRRPLHRRGAAAAHHARDLAPARLRPRRAGGGGRDVRPAEAAATRMEGQVRRSMSGHRHRQGTRAAGGSAA